jgi:hypothetical protein
MAVREIGCKNEKCVIKLQHIGPVGEVNGRIREK